MHSQNSISHKSADSAESERKKRAHIITRRPERWKKKQNEVIENINVHPDIRPRPIAIRSNFMNSEKKHIGKRPMSY